MKRFLLLILIIVIVCLGRPAFAGTEALVLQSSRLLPYEQARQGVERVLADRFPSRGTKSIQAGGLNLFVLSEEKDLRLLKIQIEDRQPELVVAIGGKALAFAADLKTSHSIVHLLVPNPERILHGRDNVTGIEMAIPPARQLEGLAAVLPGAKRIGTIYDPGKSSGLIAEAQAAAAQLGLDLRAEKAGSAKQVPELLAGFGGKIDAFWILPDLTVVTPLTLEKMLLFSVAQKIPVLSFSEKYLEAGAAVAVTFDLVAMGEKAGELALEIIQGRNAGQLVLPDKVKIEINRKILEKMGSHYNLETITAAGEPKDARR